MIRASFVLGAVGVWLAACGQNTEPPPMAAQTAPPPPPVVHQPPLPPAPHETPRVAPVQLTSAEPERPARTVTPVRDEPDERNEEPAPSAAPRDVVGELLALIQEQHCLNLGFQRSPAEGQVQIDVTAFVHADGTIERARVTATGQPLPLLRCAEVRLTSTSLKAPVPGAPNTFTGSLVLAAPEMTDERPSKPYRPPENRASASGDYTFKGPEPLDYAKRTSDDSLKGARADTMAGPPD